MMPSKVVRWVGEALENYRRVWQVSGPPAELTTEILRLFAFDGHSDEVLDLLGIRKDEMAAYRFSTLVEPGGALFAADRGGRLAGILFLVPEGLQSALSGRYIWSAKQLVIAPDAPPRTTEALLETALALLESPVDCIVARVPALDRVVVRGLQEQGFQAVGSEAVGALACRRGPAKGPPDITLASIQRRHLHRAADMLRRDGYYSSCAPPPGLDERKATRFYQYLLAGYVEEPRAGGLVAEDESGDLLGFITYKRNAWLEEFTDSSLASLDFFGVHPDSRSNGLGELLHRHALSALADQSVDAAEVRIPATSPHTAETLKLQKKLGCRAFSYDLVFRRWMS